MDSHEAARTLEVIRTLMERTSQYRLLTASAALAAGSLAGTGALLFLVLDDRNPAHFLAIWTLVFVGSLMASVVGTVMRGRERGERVWSRQTRAVILALAPSLFAGLVLSVFFFLRDEHLWLPGVWMLCYGQGALATSAYAPPPIRLLGIAVLLMGGVTLALGPAWSTILMGVVFGLGHISLGIDLLIAERREGAIRLHKSVA
jgi:hypothetical protein